MEPTREEKITRAYLSPRIHRVARGNLREDVMQDVALEMLRFCPDGLTQEQTDRYMNVCVRRRSMKLCEREAKRATLPLIEEIAGSDPFPMRDELQAVARALWALSRDQRSVILSAAVGYSYQEIAERRGWTYSKVNHLMTKAHARLRSSKSNPQLGGNDGN